MVPQTLAIYEELSAEENLRFFGRIYGLSGQQLKERVGNCLEIAGLTQRSRDRVSKYSGGMKRRLNMVCSLLHEPPLLLLDEPTVGVDPQSRNSIFDTIEAMKKQGRTIIYTTHYMEEAERLCDRVAILDHGKILDSDSVHNLIAKHGGLSHIEAEFEKGPSDFDKIKQLIYNKNIQLEETKIRFETNQPMESLAMLNRSGIHFQSLKVETANLEDVFLNLTGRRLRD
jgi:ABC-2 type transport system ATP-binding protein